MFEDILSRQPRQQRTDLLAMGLVATALILLIAGTSVIVRDTALFLEDATSRSVTAPSPLPTARRPTASHSASERRALRPLRRGDRGEFAQSDPEGL